MAGDDVAPLAPAIIIGALVIRTVFTELRHPGSARQQWAFASNPQAVGVGATVAAATLLISGSRLGCTAAAWALLVGALAAFLTGRDTPNPTSPAARGGRQTLSERQVGKVLAAVGAPLTVAGVAMYFLPGPGFPLLIIGLALLITGIAMTASTRRR
ncbi:MULTISPECIES: PGPGW domain-containing protein [unclassified Streptomyces]|uniref:PGPGW domain-containing protein n=1 Tax=unclassified Streptomyces TaxID=2593676 RepID=UPI0029B673A9|nr:PGPGW domain-containing protein [Streptomyces sp. DK15]MDX2394958.1 hypothetical protein [Streptomyces sp. DK15]